MACPKFITFVKVHSTDYLVPRFSWSDKHEERNNEIAPFLQGIDDPIITEDILINHDSNVFSDWDVVNRYKIGAIEYSKGNQRLTVVNCNRTRIEDNLGVDLIYYHHKYDAYILVQYKKMIRQQEEKESGISELIYRPIDKSYHKEIETIRNFLEVHHKLESPRKLVDYRLLSNGFFLKLCEVEKFSPLDQDLIKGMYIPFDYWETLICSEESKRPTWRNRNWLP